jgi:DNA-binding GntR family transcriptional regulator
MKSIIFKNIPLSERVFQALKDRIISGEYPPNTVLSEKEICEEFGVSRTPFRESIKKLEELKLINVVPRFGTYVSEIDIHEIRNAFEVRMNIEGFTCELAAVRQTPEELDRLANLTERLDHLLQSEDFSEGSKIDKEFHTVIRDAAHNTILKEMTERLHSICERAFSSSYRKKMSISEFVSDWKGIYGAIENRDASLANRLMSKHIQHAFDRFKSEIDMG